VNLARERVSCRRRSSKLDEKKGCKQASDNNVQHQDECSSASADRSEIHHGLTVVYTNGSRSEGRRASSKVRCGTPSRGSHISQYPPPRAKMERALEVEIELE
jgi:hypothetical protein